MKENRKKHPKLRIAILIILAVMIILGLIFMRFGGFGTGDNANPDEILAYAGGIEDIIIPDNAKIIALGEASHGNIEFQQLKLDVFKQMVEKYGVRAFALEGDYGGCEQVNRYIHGGEGTAQEAASAIGFAIYRTEQMANLISYMREYNDNAKVGDDIRFYGFDMQRASYSFRFLIEGCNDLGIDARNVEELVNGNDWSEGFDYPTRVERLKKLKEELEKKENSINAVHCVDMLLQYCELQTIDPATYGDVRDKLMAENTLWILEQEKQLGHERLFIAGHNGHVAKWGSYDAMGKILSDKLGDSYYAIGTDFYKTNCNMPSGSSGKRTKQVFYSYDPIAKGAKLAGKDICYLDFSKVPEDSELYKLVKDYVYMGSLGEGYSIIMRLLPPSYRIFQPPADMYDSMIFVTEANPTTILEKID